MTRARVHLLLSLGLALLALTGLAGVASAEGGTGNYCIGCHTASDPAPAGVLAWAGGNDREAASVCEAATAVRDEANYTGRMVLAVERLRNDLGSSAPAGTDAKITAGRQAYARLIDGPVTSLDAFTSEAQSIRYQLGKSYARLNQAADALKLQRILIAAAIVTLALLVALAWGMRNTVALGAGPLRLARFGWRGALFLLLVLVLFSLPLLRSGPDMVESGTQESMAREAALDQADRAADAGERALARAAMLARAGAAWAVLDRDAGERALSAALAASREARLNAEAQWGEAQAAQERTVSLKADAERALLVTRSLDGARSRAWADRQAAAEWLVIDPQRAGQLLAQARAQALRNNAARYRDLDLRAIAAVWAGLDRPQALETLAAIADPAIRAWGYRTMPQQSGDNSLYSAAGDSARAIANPAARARALRLVGVESGQPALLAEAGEALQQSGGAAAAYEQAELAGAMKDASLVEKIGNAYPAARALGYLRLGRHDQAWGETARIDDDLERSRARAAIATGTRDAGKARQVEEPVLRGQALAAIAASTRDAALAATIEEPYWKAVALARTGDFAAALEAAGNDPSALAAVARAWAEHDGKAALAVEPQLEREADRAIVLRLAFQSGPDATLFGRALDMALAARVRGDPTAPVEASLALGNAVARQDRDAAARAYAQAVEAAERIPVRYK